ncbi:MAG: hypothetical protein OHK0052_15790 [Anaerolineales bacterium]
MPTLRNVMKLLWFLGVLMLLAGCRAQSGLLRPNGVAVAPDGSLYIMDRGNYRVVHLAADGKFINAFGKLGSAPEDIYGGWDIVLDKSGNIYICDLVYNEDGSARIRDGVKMFTPDGKLLREIGAQHNTPEVTSESPYGLAIDSVGRIYVANIGTNSVRVFDADGNLLGRFLGETGSAPGQGNGINDVAVDEVLNLLYVADSFNSRVQQFRLLFAADGSLSLEFVRTFGEYGNDPGQMAYPLYLAVNPQTHLLYVGDMANQRIQIFDVQGNVQGEIRAPGVENWQVMGLDVAADGKIYAADALNSLIWAFNPDGTLYQRYKGDR